MRGESMKGKSKKSNYSTTFGVDPILSLIVEDSGMRVKEKNAGICTAGKHK